MSISKALCTAAVCVGSVLAAPAAFALAQRTFVASYGNDASACSLAFPCRGFAAAIAQTNPGGEVIVRDSAGYGIVTIGQSVSIVAPQGVYAGITIQGLNSGVIVNAPGSKVLLRGLTINGQTSGQFGIWLQAAAELVVDRCVVANTHDGGIYSTATGSALIVTDTLVRQTIFGPGVWIKANTRAVLERVRILRSLSALGYGVWADAASSVSIKDSIIATNVAKGVFVRALAGATASGAIDNSVISDNGGGGVQFLAEVLAGTLAKGSVMRSTITRNGLYALSASSNPPGMAFASAVGNLVTGNGGGFSAAGTGQAISARDNTFAGHAFEAMSSSASSAIHTVRGADGLPSNAGVEASPTAGTIVPVNPF